MTRRSRSREVALQLLFQFDSNSTVSRPAQEQFVRDRLRDPELEPFCLKLFDGVQANRQEIDRQLTEAAENWRLSRMAGVDRNVLRMGAYELMFEPEAPVAAIIDEAIELARRYGSKDSPAFVNGVLDRVAQLRSPTAETPAEPNLTSESTTEAT
jgi:N utilization substance protein B